MSFFNNLWNTITGDAKTVYDNTLGKAVDVGESAVTSSFDEIKSVGKTITTEFKNDLNSVENTFTNIGSGIKNEFSKDLGAVENTFSNIGSGIKNEFNTVENKIEDFGLGIKNEFSKDFDVVKNSFNTFSGEVVVIEKKIETVATDVYRIGSALYGVFENVVVPTVEWMAKNPKIVIGGGASYAGLLYYNQVKLAIK